ncbi:MAG: hypothetical protein AAFQ19_15100 [Pseudomonadota bacterium]
MTMTTPIGALSGPALQATGPGAALPPYLAPISGQGAAFDLSVLTQEPLETGRDRAVTYDDAGDLSNCVLINVPSEEYRNCVLILDDFDAVRDPADIFIGDDGALRKPVVFVPTDDVRDPVVLIPDDPDVRDPIVIIPEEPELRKPVVLIPEDDGLRHPIVITPEDTDLRKPVVIIGDDLAVVTPDDVRVTDEAELRNCTIFGVNPAEGKPCIILPFLEDSRADAFEWATSAPAGDETPDITAAAAADAAFGAPAPALPAPEMAELMAEVDGSDMGGYADALIF